MSEEVLLCKNGVPVVRLVPVHPSSQEDPCGIRPNLVIDVGVEALKPLEPEEWGEPAE